MCKTIQIRCQICWENHGRVHPAGIQDVPCEWYNELAGSRDDIMTVENCPHHATETVYVEGRCDLPPPGLEAQSQPVPQHRPLLWQKPRSQQVSGPQQKAKPQKKPARQQKPDWQTRRNDSISSSPSEAQIRREAELPFGTYVAQLDEEHGCRPGAIEAAVSTRIQSAPLKPGHPSLRPALAEGKVPQRNDRKTTSTPILSDGSRGSKPLCAAHSSESPSRGELPGRRHVFSVSELLRPEDHDERLLSPKPSCAGNAESRDCSPTPSSQIFSDGYQTGESSDRPCSASELSPVEPSCYPEKLKFRLKETSSVEAPASNVVFRTGSSTTR